MDNKIEPLYGLENDMRLLQFLRSRNTDRFTKLDAFCDLVGRMCGHMKSSKDKEPADLLPLCFGEFTGSISELAKDWHWHRATVRTFLDGLESLGVLERKLDGRDYTFMLRTQSTVTLPFVSYDEVEQLGFFLLRHWDEYSLSPEVVAPYFAAFYDALDDSITAEDTEHLETLMAKTVLEAIGNLEYSPMDISPSDDSLVQQVASTFTGPNRWSWTKWVSALMGLDMLLIGPIFPDDILDSKTLERNAFFHDFSKEDMTLVRELFNQVKKEEARLLSQEENSSSPDLKENTDV